VDDICFGDPVGEIWRALFLLFEPIGMSVPFEIVLWH